MYSVSESLDQINTKYKAAAPHRHLAYRNQIGSVKLELELGGGTKQEFTCSPVQAAIIDYCQAQPSLTLCSLSCYLPFGGRRAHFEVLIIRLTLQ